MPCNENLPLEFEDEFQICGGVCHGMDLVIIGEIMCQAAGELYFWSYAPFELEILSRMIVPERRALVNHTVLLF